MSTKIDDPVYVAINTEGVYVIDRDDFVSFTTFTNGVIVTLQEHWH